MGEYWVKVNIDINRGLYRLRWTYQSKRYILSTGYAGTKGNRPFAERKAREIEVDMLAEVFDPTLTNYKPSVRADDLPSAYVSSYRLVELFIEDKSKAVLGKSLGHYSILLRAVGEKVGEKIDVDCLTTNHVEELYTYITTRGTSYDTQHTYLVLLSAVWEWGVEMCEYLPSTDEDDAE